VQGAAAQVPPVPVLFHHRRVCIMGWHQMLLRVDLSAGTCVSEPLNMEWAQAYLGQRGLATK